MGLLGNRRFNRLWLGLSLLLLPATSGIARAGWIDLPFSQWMEKLLREPVTVGNRAELLVDGTEFYPSLLQMIRGALRSIDISMFLWCDDKPGLEIAQELIYANARGVRVRVLIDYFNFKPHNRVYNYIRHTGLPPLEFNPPFWGLDYVNARMHEKFVVVDGREAMVGGANFCDEYLTGHKTRLWHDLFLRVEGPVGARVQERFDETWNWMATEEFAVRDGYGSVLYSEERRPTVYRIYPRFHPTEVDRTRRGDSIAMFHYQQPYWRDWHGKTFRHVFSELIKRARKRVILYAPYFVSPETFEDALIAAAKKGVKVEVLTNSRATNDLTGPVNVAQPLRYERLLPHGVKIYEYQVTTLHAKAILIDDEVLSVGSHNFTNRSFKHNGEANLLVGDPAAIAKFKAMAETDLYRHSKQMVLKEIQAMNKRTESFPASLWRKFMSWLATFF